MNHYNTQKRPLQGSSFLFREAYRCFLDALYTLLTIELPRWWRSFKDNHIVGFHPDDDKEGQDFIGNVLSVFKLLAILTCGWACVWIYWILTHPKP